MTRLVFGVDRSPDPECPAWPSLERLDGMRSAAFTRYIKAAVPEARARGINAHRVDGQTVILPAGLALADKDTAQALWCQWCGSVIERSPYWTLTKTRGIHIHPTVYVTCSPS